MNLRHANKEELRKKTKDFLHGKNWHKALVFFVFVVLAFIFWLIQYYQQSIEVEVTTAIEYKDVPSGIVLSQDLPTEIYIKMADKGTAFINYNINRRNDKIQISLKNLDITKNTYFVDQTALSNAIRSHMLGSTSLLSFSPSNIIVDYSPLKSKELPVVINGSISPASGYTFSDSIRIAPNRVTAYSDSITLDTIVSISTVKVDYTDLKKDFSKNVSLITPKGVKIDISNVNISVDIEEYTEKTFTIPVKINNLPSNIKTRLFPSEAEVTCYISLKNYAHLLAEDLELSVDYKELSETGEQSFSPQLSKHPDYVLFYRITPDKVDFLIEQSE